MLDMTGSALAIISEPDSRIRHALRLELLHADWTVLLAANADEVENIAAQVSVQMIVLDVTAIKLRGYSACARLRRQAGFEHRPIILTAANVGTRDAIAAGTAGATALLAKPYSINALFRAIRTYGMEQDQRPEMVPMAPENVLDWEAANRWSFDTGTGSRRAARVRPVTTGPTVRIPIIRAT